MCGLGVWRTLTCGVLKGLAAIVFEILKVEYLVKISLVGPYLEIYWAKFNETLSAQQGHICAQFET